MDDIRKSILGARALQAARIRKSISNAEYVSRSEEDLKKAQEEEMSVEDSNEKEEEGETEKAHIMDALSYGNEIKVAKTGKEIKDQIQNVLSPKLNAELERYKAKANSRPVVDG